MKNKIRDLIKNALIELEINEDNIIIEKPNDSINGDYSSNIALKLTKLLKENPIKIAEMITAKIKDSEIDKIEIAKPGFINFFLKKNYLLDNLNEILKDEINYGILTIGNNQKINIEFVSANPTGTLHLGHARGACYGDSLANILQNCGYNVTREYYINDAGNQINNLALSIKARYNELLGLKVQMPIDGYHGKEIIEIAKSLKQKYDTVNDETFKEEGLKYLLNNIKIDLENFRVKFDVWSSEKDIYNRGLIKNVLNKLQDYTYNMEDALWLKTTAYGDEKDRVLIKSDKTNTYLLPDIAYHKDKFDRGFDKLIDVLGADHHGYIHRIKAAMEMLGEDSNNLEIKILQMVRLMQNGEEVKMSKRTGKSVTINELVDEVGLNAVRYFYSMRSIDTQMDFDMDLAIKKSNENPVYYVEYAYARICSIIKDLKINEINNYETLNSDYSLLLLRKLNEYKETLEISANRLEPHIITNYVYDLATLFHSFYAHEKVLTDDEKYTNEHINLIKATSIIIDKCLKLIGVEARERM